MRGFERFGGFGGLGGLGGAAGKKRDNWLLTSDDVNKKVTLNKKGTQRQPCQLKNQTKVALPFKKVDKGSLAN